MALHCIAERNALHCTALQCTVTVSSKLSEAFFVHILAFSLACVSAYCAIVLARHVRGAFCIDAVRQTPLQAYSAGGTVGGGANGRHRDP